jgi:predicted peptidase
MRSLRWLLPLGLLVVALPLWAADPPTGFIDRVYKGTDGAEAKYVIFVPADYKGDKPYPVILFLHGAGETGTDGTKQTKTGIGPAIRKQEKTFPCIVVFPQSQKRSWRADSEDGKRALAILEEVKKDYKVDDKRIYLTGLSMGGFGTWSMAAAHPDKWAAIVPICGSGSPATAEKIKDIPCWCFHGDADTAVKVEGSRNMIKALEAAGAKPKYSEYPGVGHNSWDKAYGTKELWEWLLMQQKK